MSAPVPDAPATGDTGTPPAANTPPPPAPAPTEPTGSGTGSTSATDTGTDTGAGPNVSSGAGAEVEALRAELAEWRTKAEGAQQGIVDKIAKALGIAGADEAPTVEQVTEQLTTAQRDARERTVDLAVYRAAPTAGADPDALLDSTAFRRRVADLEPTTDGFADEVAAAIGEALKTNPRLAAAPATASPAPRSGGQITGGSPTGAEDLGSLSVEDYIKRTRKRGN